jgi:hypothetical protein
MSPPEGANQAEKAGNGQHLALTSDYLCWQDLVNILNAQGHKLDYERVSAEDYDSFSPVPGNFAI